jgi:DNA-binding transcriptional LysR family regulator
VIDLRHMRYTIAAADYRSLRRAAEAMHLKQSTLSRCVRELEDELQVTLFVRSRAGVRPTAAGAAFITSVRRVVQEIEGIATMARAAGRGEVGRITIGFYTSLSTGNLRATLLDYIERFPKVEIGILQGSRAELFTAIDNGTLDIAIVTGEPNGPHRRGALERAYCGRGTQGQRLGRHADRRRRAPHLCERLHDRCFDDGGGCN